MESFEQSTEVSYMDFREEARRLRQERLEKTLDQEHLRIPKTEGRVHQIDETMRAEVTKFLRTAERKQMEESLEALEGYEDLTSCPKCKSGEIHYHGYEEDDGGDVWRCQNCGFQWLGVDAITPDMVKELGMRPRWGESKNYKHD